MHGLRLLLLCAGLTALLACGGGGTPSSGNQPAGSTKIVEMDFSFQSKAISVSSGKVVFWLVNNGPAAHDVVIADKSGSIVARSQLVQAGSTDTLSVANLAAGTYAFYCDVSGHRAAGMEGVLTVT